MLPSAWIQVSAGNLATTQGVITQIKKDIKQTSQSSLLTAPTLEDAAALCGLVSMESTMRSNLTVGPPIEVLMYEEGSLTVEKRYRFEESSEYLRQLNSSWDDRLREAFNNLPPIAWSQAWDQAATNRTSGSA